MRPVSFAQLELVWLGYDSAEKAFELVSAVCAPLIVGTRMDFVAWGAVSAQVCTLSQITWCARMKKSTFAKSVLVGAQVLSVL